MIEHPDITKCLSTGYHHSENPAYCCDECGAQIYDGEIYYDFETRFVCIGCMNQYRKIAERQDYE